MIVNQQIVTTVLAAPLTACYWICGLVRRRHLKYEDAIVFGLFAAGIVTGIYIIIGAFKCVETGNVVSIVVFGISLTLISTQKVIASFAAILRKPGNKKIASGN